MNYDGIVAGTYGAPFVVTPVSNGVPITDCTIAPTLPAWAIMNPQSCQISGTPNAALPPTTYTVTAINAVGTSTPATVILTIAPLAPTLSYSGATGTSGTFGVAMSVSPTGILDLTTLPIFTGVSISAAATYSNQILLSGYTTNHFALASLDLTTGAVITSFGTNGLYTGTVNTTKTRATSLAVDASNKMLWGGGFTANASANTLMHAIKFR